MSLNIAAGLGPGGTKIYPDPFQPCSGSQASMWVEDRHITRPELPGIGFKGKADLIRVMREPTA